ncbi:MAG TPA: DegQ family serine endoprotease [Burkholderiales bacterium]|nr:DegQ family serine endoprotease [Burkholderiales bacterium]
MISRTIGKAAVCALVPVLVAGCISKGATASTTAMAKPEAPVATQASATPSVALPDFSALAAQAGPAVVNISITKTVANVAQTLPFDQNDPFFQFFKRFQIPMPQQSPAHGIGSGFIISPDGYILTNAHVVNGATEVDVKLTDRREFKSKVIGSDSRTDVALLKIDAKGLPTLKIGDPSKVRVGQWVVAMGSPFGFENSVTAGIVSAKSRTLPDSGYVPFIQTDVAVNPGNSGGPLFDLKGEVIGINSQIYSQTGGYMGLSFAIPIDVAMHVEEQLQRYGKVTHGRLGVTIQEIDQNLAESFGLKKVQGALVSAVENGSPAARAGVKPGDVILGFDGKAVDHSSTLPLLVGDMKPGQIAELRVWRDGSERTLKVTVGAAPAEQVASSNAPAGNNSGRLGLIVRPLTSDEIAQMHVKGGLVVEESGGAAAKAGIEPGDVILALNEQPVKSTRELRRLLDKSGKRVALLVQRNNSQTYVPVDLG